MMREKNNGGDGVGQRIGLLGIGAIGRDVVEYLSAPHKDREFFVLRRSDDQLDLPHVHQLRSIDDLISVRPDIVVEAAGHHALEHSVPALLRAGVPVIAASVGSLVQENGSGLMADVLKKLADDHHARLLLPAGAIGGLDYIGAVAHLPDLRIVYTSRKPPAAWHDELTKQKIDPASLKNELALFEGSVAAAAALYPRNLNVAATLALACGRPETVSVRVVVDPAARGNIHEIVCESCAGSARFEFINAPAPSNPKTSMVTALSLAHGVEEFLAGQTGRH
jgi:aspartate dehydrogenase